jgi:hypothetical protein
MDLLKVELGSYSETCHDGNQFIDVKVEEGTVAQEEEEDPLLITFPIEKSELEVSCMMVFIIAVVFLISICLSICMKHLHSSEWILKNPFHNV